MSWNRREFLIKGGTAAIFLALGLKLYDSAQGGVDVDQELKQLQGLELADRVTKQTLEAMKVFRWKFPTDVGGIKPIQACEMLLFKPTSDDVVKITNFSASRNPSEGKVTPEHIAQANGFSSSEELLQRIPSVVLIPEAPLIQKSSESQVTRVSCTNLGQAEIISPQEYAAAVGGGRVWSSLYSGQAGFTRRVTEMVRRREPAIVVEMNNSGEILGHHAGKLIGHGVIDPSTDGYIVDVGEAFGVAPGTNVFTKVNY